ncbi:TPA: hypothetical protein ACLAJP_000143 [Neisseria meningitidis]
MCEGNRVADARRAGRKFDFFRRASFCLLLIGFLVSAGFARFVIAPVRVSSVGNMKPLQRLGFAAGFAGTHFDFFRCRHFLPFVLGFGF